MSTNNTTMTRRALSNICTSLCTLGVYLLFSNLWVTLLTLVGLGLIFAVLFTKHGFTKRFKVLLVVLLLIIAFIMLFCRFKPADNKNVDDNNPGVVDIMDDKDGDDDNETDPTDDQKVITDEEDTGSSGGGSKWTRSDLPDKITPSYSNTDGLKKPNGENNGGQGQTKVEGPSTIVVIGESQTSNEELEASKNAENNGDTMHKLDEGIIAGTKPVEEEKEPVKDETKREDPSKNHVEEIKSTTTPTTPSTDEQITLEEQLKDDLTDDELENLLDSTSKEDSDKNTNQEVNDSQTGSDNQASQQRPVTPEDSNSKEDNADDTEIETPTQPKEEVNVEENDGNDVTDQVPEQGEKEEEVIITTPVTITPLDGDQAYAGDSVQFKVTGDVQGVSGLDGLQYTFSNGYLTVETNPNEATVLSPVIIGADGVSTSTSVTINVINVQ